MLGPALRKCMMCRLLFNSSCPGERYCPTCRKKHKARLQSAVDVVMCTVAMDRHMQTTDLYRNSGEPSPSAALRRNVEQCLEDPSHSFDDAEIYMLIDKASRPKRKGRSSWALKKTEQKTAEPEGIPDSRAPEPPAEAAAAQAPDTPAPNTPATASNTRTYTIQARKVRWNDECLCG